MVAYGDPERPTIRIRVQAVGGTDSGVAFLARAERLDEDGRVVGEVLESPGGTRAAAIAAAREALWGRFHHGWEEQLG